jgi:xylulokinase
MSYLGLDIGTTGCKAGVFNEQGRLLALAYREYPLLSPERGWAELDSARVCQDCMDAVREAAAQTAADPVRALGISTQGEAFTPVAPDGRILGNGMVSSDARAADLVQSFGDSFGRRRLYDITGHTPHPMFTLFKLLWLREHRPEIWSSGAKFYCYEDLFQQRLGLEPAISWPLAGRTMFFDVRRHCWDPQILDAMELDPSRLARPAASGTVVGTIPASVAQSIGLGAEVQVVAGGHDQPCGALGAGVVEPGVAMYASGTVECICPAFAEPRFDDRLLEANLCTYDYTIPGMYTTVLFSLTGGNLLRWFRDQWAESEVAEARRQNRDPYELILERLPADPTDLMVLPYFTPSGTPYFDAALPGAILGLRLDTTRGQVLRALLEGVAFEMRLNLDMLAQSGLPIHQLRAIGGGAKNPALVQLKADVMGRPIATLAVTEAACLGAAMLACAAHRKASPRDLVDTWIKPQSTVDPNPRRAAAYDERFAAYRKLYPAMKRTWEELRRE